MYFATQYYGRKGLVLSAISGVDLAYWDLLGKVRGEPVLHLLGGPVRTEQPFYATGSRAPIWQRSWASSGANSRFIMARRG